MRRWNAAAEVRTDRPAVGERSWGVRAHAYACLACRRSFKRPAVLGWGPGVLPCPRCRGTAIDLGRHFKPPPASDLAGWRVVQALAMEGFSFFKVGEPYPMKLREVAAFVARHRSHAEAVRRRNPEHYAEIIAAACGVAMRRA